MKRIRAIVVDDEPLARQRIRALLVDEHDIEVIAECDGGVEAAQAILNERPDLVFLDVQMPDMDGLAVLQLVTPTHVPEIIFVTAYDEYAIPAFEASAADYLLKPFDNARFKRALARVRERLADQQSSPIMEELISRLSPPRYLNRLVVRADQRYRILRVESIDWIEVTGNYLTIHVDKESFSSRGALSALEAILDPAQFLRIHRSTLVNINRIEFVDPWNQSEYMITLTGGVRLNSSRAYRGRIRAYLQGSRVPSADLE